MNDEDTSVNVGYKNEAVETDESKDVNLEVKDEVKEERFGRSEEDDEWEGIEISELYNDYKSATAFVPKQENDIKFIILTHLHAVI